MTGQSISDANAITETSMYICPYTASNIPITNTGTIISNGNVNTMTQYYISVTGKAYIRTKNDGVWSGWSQLMSDNLESASVKSANGNYKFEISMHNDGFCWIDAIDGSTGEASRLQFNIKGTNLSFLHREGYGSYFNVIKYLIP